MKFVNVFQVNMIFFVQQSLHRCSQNGASNEVIVLFNGMRETGPNPDKVTMIEVLSGCSTIGAFDLGKWVETHASERGLQHDVYVVRALIDMYAKCGSF
jgi:hypothetical protein